MLDRRGASLLILLLCASCTAPSLGVRSLSSYQTAESGITVPLEDPLPAEPPRLPYKVVSLLGEMLSWSPLHRRPRVAEADDEALGCLTAAVYYEARSESEEGQRAVAQVVLNRVGKPAFARSVCGVIHQRSAASGGCQFDFVCDGAQHGRRESGAWSIALRIARRALGGETYEPIGSSTFYHTVAVSPDWSHRFVRVTRIGAHIFYKARA